MKNLLSVYGYAAALIIFCAGILLIPVALNGFPFIFPDSGDYLIFTPRIYRSPYYGLFIFFFHMNRFIWMPIVAQAVIVAHLLWLMLRLHDAYSAIKFVALAAILMAFSSVPYFIGYIMADIFTPIMFIALYIIGFHFSELSRMLRVYIFLLACIAIAAHPSHLIMAVLFVCSSAVFLPWPRSARGEIGKRLAITAAPVALAAMAIFSYNIAVFHAASLTPAGPNFFMANLIAGGPARAYLKEACPGAGYKICNYVDRLPDTADELLWHSKMFGDTIGFKALPSDESGKIVKETIKRYPLAVAEMITRNFINGLTTHEAAIEICRESYVPWNIPIIEQKFGSPAVSAYMNSAEMKNAIPHEAIRMIDSIVVPASFFLLIALGAFSAWGGERRHAVLAIIMIYGVLLNTLLCTAVSGVHDRYQARVTWLLPMAACIVGAHLLSGRKNGQPA